MGTAYPAAHKSDPSGTSVCWHSSVPAHTVKRNHYQDTDGYMGMVRAVLRARSRNSQFSSTTVSFA